MTYSLISPSALGFDLVRQSGGPQIAEIILGALGADESALLALASADPALDTSVVRRRQWAVFNRQMRETARSAVPQLRDMNVLLHGGGLDVANDLLARGAIGNATDLERFIRSEVLGSGHRAAQKVGVDVTSHAANVLCDAAIAHWADGVLSDEAEGALCASWSSHRPVPHLDMGPAHLAVQRLLRELRDIDGVGLELWRGSAAATSGPRWSAAVHEASWAAHLFDRSREITTAHLLGVIAFRQAGLTRFDASNGVWGSLSGVLHALLVSDVVPEDSLTVLRRPVVPAGPGTAADFSEVTL